MLVWRFVKWLAAIDFDFLLRETTGRRLRPNILRVVNELIVAVLQGNIVQIILQVLRLQRVYTLVLSYVVQLELVLDPDLLLTNFFLLVV